MRKFALASALALALGGCSDVPDQIHRKLLCLHETNEAYTAVKNVGDTMFLKRVAYADSLCKKPKNINDIEPHRPLH